MISHDVNTINALQCTTGQWEDFSFIYGTVLYHGVNPLQNSAKYCILVEPSYIVYYMVESCSFCTI